VSEPVKFIESVVSLDYERPLTLATREYLDAIRDKRIIAHRCPSCDRVYTPPKGYCPICTVPHGKENEIELSSTGTLVSFSILNPDALHVGQESTVRGTVQLDGSEVAITGDLKDVKPDDAHPGIRLRAVFSNPSDNEAAEGAGWGGFGIAGWERTGEPDVPADEVKRLGTGGAV
jgi:uncharacterized OB-fold protein